MGPEGKDKRHDHAERRARPRPRLRKRNRLCRTLALAEEALSAAPSGPLRAIVSIDGRAENPPCWRSPAISNACSSPFPRQGWRLKRRASQPPRNSSSAMSAATASPKPPPLPPEAQPRSWWSRSSAPVMRPRRSPRSITRKFKNLACSPPKTNPQVQTSNHLPLAKRLICQQSTLRRTAKTPLACRPSPPQGGRDRGAGARQVGGA